VESLTFSPDGKTLATGGGGGETDVRLWEPSAVTSGSLVVPFQLFGCRPDWSHDIARISVAEMARIIATKPAFETAVDVSRGIPVSVLKQTSYSYKKGRVSIEDSPTHVRDAKWLR